MLQWFVYLILGSILIGIGGGVLSTGACIKWDDDLRERTDWKWLLFYAGLIVAGFGLVALGYIDNPLFKGA